MKTAKNIFTVKLKDRDMSVYKLNHSVKYKNMDGTFGETRYILVSVLNEAWVREVLAFACNPNGRILDFETTEFFSEEGITNEEEALVKQGYKIIK